MFIPYASDQPFYRRPWVTYGILLINFVVLIYEKTLSYGGYLDFLNQFAYSPATGSLPALITSLFVHAGILHFLGNMWMFALVAPVIEDRFGSIKFLILYLGSGVAGTLFQTLFIPPDQAHTLIFGSSGCVFGIMGAYALLFPYSSIKVFYFLFLYYRVYSGTFKCPALLLFGLYFLMNVFNLWIVPDKTVAYGAHSAGFIIGAAAVAILFGFKHFVGEENSPAEGLKDYSARTIKETKKSEDVIPELTLEKAREQLQRLVFIGDADEVEKFYSEALALFPDLVLEPGPQYDLASFLARHGKDALALHSFERLIESAPGIPIAEQALLSAAQLCMKIPGKEEQALDYLNRFIKTNLTPQQYQEAAYLIQQIEAQMKEKHQKQTHEDFISTPEAESPEEKTLEQPEQTPESLTSLTGGSEPTVMEKKTEDKKVKDILDVSMTSLSGLDFIDLELDKEELAEEQSSPGKPASVEEQPGIEKTRTFAPITDEQTLSQSSDRPPITEREISEKKSFEEKKVVPKPKSAVTEKKKLPSEDEKIDWENKRYFLIIPLKEKIKFRQLAETIASYSKVSLAEAERALVNGKGIILHDVPYTDAKELRSALREKGQNIIAIVDEDSVRLPPVEEALKGWFYAELLELQLEESGESRQFKWKDVLLLSCGNVDCDPGRGAYKNLLDIIVSTDMQTRQRIRIWESTFDFKSSNLPLKKLAQENFLMLVKQIFKHASNAVMTQVVIEMMKQDQLSPRQFGSMETYENYLLWNYLYHFGKRLPDK